VETGDLARPKTDRRREVQLEQELAAAKARIAALEQANQDLNSRLASIAALAAATTRTPVEAVALERSRPKIDPKSVRPVRVVAVHEPPATGDDIHPAARKLLVALAQHAPARFTWGQVATLAGLKPTGGHFNAGRKSLREAGYIAETDDLLSATAAGLKAAGEVPPAPSTPAERLMMWCHRLPSPAPEMLRALAAQGERYLNVDELAAMLGKKPSGGHWHSGIAVLRNNGLIETDGKSYRIAVLFRE
jgi:uncharacterized protein